MIGSLFPTFLGELLFPNDRLNCSTGRGQPCATGARKDLRLAGQAVADLISPGELARADAKANGSNELTVSKA
jgi:hypothetical protein